MESQKLLLALTSVVVLGVGAKWLAMRYRLPAILCLLVTGFLAGWIGIVDPDLIFGDLLMPFVSLCVALILFEGGLTLRMGELPGTWNVVRNLISVGMCVNWLFLTCAGHWLLGMDWLLSSLLSAILVVSGPTVIGPLLQQVRPAGSVSTILKWEGIMIDPVGVMLAVLVFSTMSGEVTAGHGVVGVVVQTAFAGTLVGLAGASLLLYLLRAFVIPDQMQSPVTLMLVLVAFGLANEIQHEAGLLAVTLMGLIVANQRDVAIRHIVEFKENLRVLIISILFILLAARITVDDLAAIDGAGWVFVALVIFVARPLAVLVSTWKSELTWQERLFLCWVGPKGIVAAALASILAAQLVDVNQVHLLVPITFTVIFSSVVFCGLTAGWVARRLGLAQADPQGFLILGAHSWARAIARQLQQNGCDVLLVDSNANNVALAAQEGIPTCHGDILKEHTLDELEAQLSGIGRLLALTPNEEVNTLACMHFRELFGRINVFQLSAPYVQGVAGAAGNEELAGRRLSSEELTHESLTRREEQGATIESVEVDEHFEYEAFLETDAVPLLIFRPDGKVSVATLENKLKLEPGQRILAQLPQNADELQSDPILA